MADQTAGSVCSDCHEPGTAAWKSKPMFDGLDMRGVVLMNPVLTWEFVDRLKDITNMKIVLKGIVTSEDASLCLDHGVDGVIVSNNGGRAEPSGVASISSLPEVVSAVRGRIPVLVDGGFRRGADIYKALALGADAVCIGRPYIWGLGAFGQEGVEAVLDLLRKKLCMVMRQMGTPRSGEITEASLRY